MPAPLRDQEWRCTDTLNVFALSEVFSAMSETDDDESPLAFGAVYDLLKVALHKDDWPKFRRWAKGLDEPLTTDEMMALTQALIGEAANRPPVTSSDSQHGRHHAGPASVGVYSSPDSHRHLGLVPVNEGSLWSQAS